MLGTRQVDSTGLPVTQILFNFIFCVSVFAWASVYHVHTVPVVACRGQKIPGNEVEPSCLCLGSVDKKAHNTIPRLLQAVQGLAQGLTVVKQAV